MLPQSWVRRLLTAWSGFLAILIISSIRSIPPLVLGILLPYLAMVGWYLLTASTPIEVVPEPLPDDSGCVPDSGSVAQESTIPASACPGDQARSQEVPETSPAPAAGERPSTTAPARARRRARPKVVAVPSPPPWVQIGPGRFVRDEEAEPSSDPSQPDGPNAGLSVAPVGPTSVDAPPGDPSADETMLEAEVDRQPDRGGLRETHGETKIMDERPVQHLPVRP